MDRRLTATLVAAALIAAPLTLRADPGPRLTFPDGERQDFGRVEQGAPVLLRFAFRNAGALPLRLTRVQPTCGCTAAQLPKSLYQPGEAGEITVRVDTRDRSGRLHKLIVVESTDPERPRLTLTLTGEVKPPPGPRIATDSADIDLGRQDSAGAARFLLTLRNLGSQPLLVEPYGELSGLRLDEPGPWRLAPGSDHALRGALLISPHERGFVERRLTLASNDPKRPLLPLSLHAWRPPDPAAPRLRLSRERWWPPALTPGAPPATATASLRNDGPAPLPLPAPRASHPQLQAAWDRAALAPGETATLTLSLSPQDRSERLEAQVELGLEDAGAPLAIAVEGWLGWPQRRDPEPGAADIELGALAPGEPLRLTLAHPDAEAPWQLPASARLISSAAGQSIVELTAPEVDGLASWLLRRGADEVRIRGQVIGAPAGRLRLSPSALDLGEVAAGQRAEAELWLCNEGEAALELEELTPVLGPRGRALRFELPPRGALAPGARVAIEVRVEASPRLGLIEAALFARSDDPAAPTRRAQLSAWVTAPAEGAPLRILYESDMGGEIEPCGCGGKEQLGGLPRLASAVAEARAEVGAPALLLSAGDIAGGATELDARRARVAYESLGLAGAFAFVPGEQDLARGVEALLADLPASGPRVVLTNLGPRHAGRIPPMLIFEPEGRRIGILGILDPGLIPREADRARLGLTHPLRALEAGVAALEGEGCRRIVLLAHTGVEVARDLVERVPGVDLAIVGHGDERIAEPQLVGRALLVCVPDRGQHLGLLDLVAPPSARPGAPWLGWRGEARPLGETWARDPAVAAVLARYREGLRELPAPELPLPAGQPSYVGSAACIRCHEAEGKVWRASRHAAAMLSLERSGSDYDPRCTSCHTVGQGEPTGFRRRDLSPALEQVQCESCHGPGSEHVAHPPWSDKPDGVRLPSLTLESCEVCHNGKHSPSFDAAAYWRNIAHGEDPLRALWDADADGRLNRREEEALRRFQAERAEHEAARRAAATEKKGS